MLKKRARLAGLLYLTLAFIAPFGIMYVPSRIMVPGDTAATARNILAHEFLFRAGIAANILSHVLMAVLVLLLYRLFKPVGAHSARLMAVLIIMASPVSFTADVLRITALRIFRGDILKTFEPGQVNDVAMAFIKTANYCGQMVTVYWGLWLIPLGFLVYRSGFIPRILGVLLWINGAGYVIHCFVFTLFPEYLASISGVLMATYFAGEIPLILWLLIKGIKE